MIDLIFKKMLYQTGQVDCFFFKVDLRKKGADYAIQMYNRIVRSVFILSVLIIAIACIVSALTGGVSIKKVVIAPIICCEFLFALGLIWLILVLNRFRMRAAEKEDPLTIAQLLIIFVLM